MVGDEESELQLARAPLTAAAIGALAMIGVGVVIGRVVFPPAPPDPQPAIAALQSKIDRTSSDVSDIKVTLAGFGGKLDVLDSMQKELSEDREKLDAVTNRVTALEAGERAEAAKREARAAHDVAMPR